MSGKVSIPVEARVDAGDLQQATQQFVQQFNKLGAAVAQANKVKFSPIDKATIDDLRRVQAQFESLRKISGALNQRLKATGQGGAGFFDIDWGRMYSDPNAQARKMREAFEYVTGHAFQGVPPATAGTPTRPAPSNQNQPQPRPPAPSPGVHWGGAGRRIVSSGLQASGAAGGVADGALSAGLAGGAMAGLAGLVGGIVALGVGKAVSSVVGRIGDAEAERIGIDTLKRSLGDVNVGFHTLKESLRATAGDLQIPINEAGKLGAEFAKIADLTPEAYRTLATEVGIAGGFGRSFGMDPATSNAFFAQMRLMRVTENEQDSRRLSLMIGEAIAKSGSFAKADEVLQAIGNFAAQQTRLGLTPANVGAYGGFLAAMAGDKRPGLDVAGSAAIIGRANQAIQQGGAAGEAGQNFLYAALGSTQGLNPVQARALWEQGLFGTAASTFGRGGTYDEFAGAFGGTTPATDGAVFQRTTLDLVMKKLLENFRGRPDLMADAMANLFGINVSQAMAFATVANENPQALGDIQRRLQRSGVDLSRVNASGIAALARVETGGHDVLTAQANSLFGRTGRDALSPEERDRLRAAMASGNDETMRDVLAELTATRAQEETEGSRTRQTIVDLQNAMQVAADRLVDPLTDIRAGILHMAGVETGMGPMGIKLAVARAESRERLEVIGARSDPQILAEREREARSRSDSEKLRNDKVSLAKVGQWSSLPAEERARIDGEIARLQKEEADAQAQRAELERQKAAQIAAEEARLKAEQEEIRGSFAGTPATSPDALLDAVIQQESRGQHIDPATGGMVTNKRTGARGVAQIMPGTEASPGFGVRPLQNDSEAEHRRFASDYLAAMLERYDGDRRKALAAYNAGPGRVDALIAKHGDAWLSHAPKETRDYVPSVLANVDGYDTPVPTGVKPGGTSPSGGQPQRVALEGTFRLESPRGESVAAPVEVRKSISIPRPYGAPA